MKFFRNVKRVVMHYVAPFAGAWIEISDLIIAPVKVGSLPSRERGLKLYVQREYTGLEDVAPFAGAWIEIYEGTEIELEVNVAPFAGAWIEISQPLHCQSGRVCRSLRGSVD